MYVLLNFQIQCSVKLLDNSKVKKISDLFYVGIKVQAKL